MGTTIWEGDTDGGGTANVSSLPSGRITESKGEDDDVDSGSGDSETREVILFLNFFLQR